MLEAFPPSCRSNCVNLMTAEVWAKHERHEGDRWCLFRSVAAAVDAGTVFYPGSYIDIAPSFVFDSFIDLGTDKRTSKFFAGAAGIHEIVADHHGPADVNTAFIHADYTSELDLPSEHFASLISVYAGFVSEHCTPHLRANGMLLVNPSHGGAAMAPMSRRYELSGLLNSTDNNYTVRTRNLDIYPILKKLQPVTIDTLREPGQGIGNTKSPFDYLFTRVK